MDMDPLVFEPPTLDIRGKDLGQNYTPGSYQWAAKPDLVKPRAYDIRT